LGFFWSKSTKKRHGSEWSKVDFINRIILIITQNWQNVRMPLRHMYLKVAALHARQRLTCHQKNELLTTATSRTIATRTFQDAPIVVVVVCSRPMFQGYD
jgi:hypothetical protein